MKTKLLSSIIIILIMACQTKPKDELVGTGSAGPAQIPPEDMVETSLLTAKLWVFEHWVDIDNPSDKSNKGRWYRFYKDGTYDGGHWEDHNDRGTWFLRKGAQYTNLFIDSEIDDLLDAKWEIQNIRASHQEMSWVKTSEFGDGKTPLCKVMSLLTIPTKKQFGVD